MQGLPWVEIAAREGYAHPQGPHNIVMAYLKDVQAEDAEQLRAIENARLDELLSAHYAAAVDPQHEQRFRATDRVLSIMDRRAKLNGLDVQRVALDSGPLSLSVILARGLELLKLHPELEGKDGS